MEIKEIQQIMLNFGLTVQNVINFYDTSRGDDDERFNYVLDDKYVLKVNSAGAIREERLQEIRRLIARYRSVGVYCPDIMPALDGGLSHTICKDGREYICFVEEYARFPVLEEGTELDRREVIEHLGVLAAKYTGVDLSETRSMWSIIDLAPFDTDIDEKQENADLLVAALRKYGYNHLAERVDSVNSNAREKIMTVFGELPRCVYQGDLNNTNILVNDGRFAGLIDFNMSGTDVNINVFLNETNWFPEEDEFDSLSVPEIIARQDREQEDNLAVILKHYSLNDAEKYAFPYYKRIVDMFQYPDVCEMVEWLKDDARRDKCADLIRAMADKPL